MEFKTIETQEELDKIVQKRLAKEQAKHEKAVEAAKEEYESKLAEYEAKVAELEKSAGDAQSGKDEYEKKISELETKIKGYETDSVKTKVALEMGIPYELAGKLSGDSEDDIRKDAETLSKFVSSGNKPPLADTEGNADGDNDYREILNSLKGD